MSAWHVRLSSQTSTTSKPFSLFSRVVFVMPENMPTEAHCQEIRGINAEIIEKLLEPRQGIISGIMWYVSLEKIDGKMDNYIDKLWYCKKR